MKMNRNTLYQIMKEAAEAIKFDSQNNFKRAYEGYLHCLQTISTELLLESQRQPHDVIEPGQTSVQAFALSQQCMDRIAVILQNADQKHLNSDNISMKMQAKEKKTNVERICGRNPISSEKQPNCNGTENIINATVAYPPFKHPASNDISISSSLPVDSNGSADSTVMVAEAMRNYPTEACSVPEGVSMSQAGFTTSDTNVAISNNTVSEIDRPVLDDRQPLISGCIQNTADMFHENIQSIRGSQESVRSEECIDAQSSSVVVAHGSASLPTYDRWFIPPLPSDPDSLPRNRTKSAGRSPIELARHHNQLLSARYKHYTSSLPPPAAATLKLTLQRKMAENLALARVREETIIKRIRERQLRLEEEASRRFSSVMGISKEDQEYRRVYKKILEYEQDAKWLHDWREKLREYPKQPCIIRNLISEILKCADHPLTQLLKSYQYKIYERLYPLVANNLKELDNVSVPLNDIYWLTALDVCMRSIASKTQSIKDDQKTKQNIGPSDNAESCANTEQISCPEGQRISDTSLQNLSRKESITFSKHSLFKDKAINNILDFDEKEYKGASNVTEDINSNTIDQVRTDSVTDDVEYNSIESHVYNTEGRLSLEFLKMKQHEERMIKDIRKTTEEIYDDILSSNVTLPDFSSDSQSGQSNPSKSNIPANSSIKFDNLKDDYFIKMANDAYSVHVETLKHDVHRYIEKLLVIFVVAYEDLDTMEGRDLCYAYLEVPFFTPLWKYMMALFRLRNFQKELCVAMAMTELREIDLKDLSVKANLRLELDRDPYDVPIQQLKSFTTWSTPLSKLEALVSMVQSICQYIDDYYNSHDALDKKPSIGADELMPILTYIVIRSGIPQLVSECDALEEFVQEGYLMGEEGYCLTSLVTATNYVINLGEKILLSRMTPTS